MKTKLTSVTAVAAILVVVATLFFLIVRITPLFIAAYVLALLGIAVLWLTSTQMVKDAKNYPWAAAVPAIAVEYLVTELIGSAVVVVLEQIGLFALHLSWFIVSQLVVFAFFAVRIIVLSAGKAEIERRGDDVKERGFLLKSLVADLDMIFEKASDEAKHEIKPVCDALRYSDPMTNPQLAEYDNAVSESIIKLDYAVTNGNNEQVTALCVTLQRQIKERNSRAKLVK